MRIAVITLALTVVAATTAAIAQSQAETELLSRDRAKTLAGLPPLALVVRPDMRVAAIAPAQLHGLLKAALSRAVPALTFADNAGAAQAWAELTVVTAREGGRVQLSIYRRVRIEGATEDIIAPIWSDSRLILRGVNRTIIRQSIDSLAGTLAADYSKATH